MGSELVLRFHDTGSVLPGLLCLNIRRKIVPVMKAARIHSFGEADGALRLDEMPKPSPGAGDLLIKLVATSVNPVDLMIRTGRYPRVPHGLLPYLGGRDVAGHVEAVGAQVDPMWVGRPVFGSPDFSRGAFAEYILLREDEVSAAPVSIPLRDAGTIPLAGLTAWQGLHRFGRLELGQQVLVHGASGGVGHFAVQLAKAAGAFVIASASARHRDLLYACKADHVISYDTERFEDVAGDVDLVLDMVGGETQRRSWSVLRPGGRLISAVEEPDPEMAARHEAGDARFFIAQSDADDLAAIARLVDAGQVRVNIQEWFALDQIAMAQARLHAGGVAGKIGVRIS
jgi:NADPH:quinone reductase-like Zn-dependent oxidoreductase